MAYALMVFGKSGGVAATYEIAADHDRDALLQIGGIDLPHGAELRRGQMVVAKFGCYRMSHDHAEPGAMTRIHSILGRRAA